MTRVQPWTHQGTGLEPHWGRGESRTVVGVWLALFLAALLLNGCTRAQGDPETKTLEGVITAVEADSIVEWRSITVREASGQEHTFLRGEGVDLRYWRASHIREHMMQADLVTVTYRETRGLQRQFVAESIEHKASG